MREANTSPNATPHPGGLCVPHQSNLGCFARFPLLIQPESTLILTIAKNEERRRANPASTWPSVL